MSGSGPSRLCTGNRNRNAARLRYHEWIPSRLDSKNTCGLAGQDDEIWEAFDPPRGEGRAGIFAERDRRLAGKLDIPADEIEVVSGHSSPSKVLAINGIDEETLKKALE